MQGPPLWGRHVSGSTVDETGDYKAQPSPSNSWECVKTEVLYLSACRSGHTFIPAASQGTRHDPPSVVEDLDLTVICSPGFAQISLDHEVGPGPSSSLPDGFLDGSENDVRLVAVGSSTNIRHIPKPLWT